jgi:hypothetical protein
MPREHVISISFCSEQIEGKLHMFDFRVVSEAAAVDPAVLAETLRLLAEQIDGGKRPESHVERASHTGWVH